MLTGVGIAIGLIGALGVTRVMRALLYETSPTDPLTFAGVVPVLARSTVGVLGASTSGDACGPDRRITLRVSNGAVLTTQAKGVAAAATVVVRAVFAVPCFVPDTQVLSVSGVLSE